MTATTPPSDPERKVQLLRRLADAPLSPKATQRLAEARRNALAHAHHGTLRGWITSAGTWLAEHGHARTLIAAAALGVVLMAGSGWFWHQREAEFAFDKQMLTDDIPLDVLVNGNFDTWHAESR
ncbi:DUF3619 family protein [Jeongeupia chitinilytica]|uniref:DUF3619 family protein n=1 Tax=Jeongeupia chitinilytica TaxID=1041641 RepID=A0ABQ3H4Y2_9NEIS|nr:DUF3619 family protein [Jeongeupia chitinilytica]GHD66460.1 hypothetical protein GCM10007350_28710 [Jeongeupia chitinilytica]